MAGMHASGPGDDGRPEGADERSAAAQLNVGARQKRLRRFWRSLPTEPRCKLCNSPFGGPAGSILRRLGKGPWPANPKYCRFCFRALYQHHSGAEIECSLLFADIRGSTQIAEAMRPNDYRALLDRFYAAASAVLVDHDAIVDKFVGDEVIGIFIPALTEELHARRAIDAALGLLRATGHDGERPWLPVGIGVNTGRAYVGTVGTAEHVEFTALGDAVNTTARLSSAAAAGEILVTDSAVGAARLDDTGLERRHLDLRGKSETTDVLVLTVAVGAQSVLQRHVP
jgi:adenylate cyclase